MKNLIFYIFVLVSNSIVCHNGLTEQEINLLIKNYVDNQNLILKLKNSVAQISAATNIQNDKILVATSCPKLDRTFSSALSSYNSDLSLNKRPSEINLKLNSEDLNYGIKAISVQPDNKILIGGFFNKGKDSTEIENFNFYVSRLNADFSIDTSFGSNNSDSNSNVFAINHSDIDSACIFSKCVHIAIQPDNKKIVVAVNISAKRLSHGLLIRLNSDGSRDLSFGNNGIVLLPAINTKDEFNIYSTLITDNGNILVLAGCIVGKHSFIFNINSSGNLLAKVTKAIYTHDDSDSEKEYDSE